MKKQMTEKLNTNKGITLIALVITIIVMLILVAVTISMAVNGGLFEYAGRATGETQNAINKEGELGSGKITVDNKVYNSIDEYLEAQKGGTGNNQSDSSRYVEGDYIYTRTVVSGNSYGAQTLEEAREILKKEYLSYYEEGTTWEDILADYGVSEEVFFSWKGLVEEEFEPAVLGGWQVTINENVTDQSQTTYGPILESIYGIPVTSLEFTFDSCTRLTTAPVIPSSVTNMTATFKDCTSLTDVSNIIIPSSVTDMSGTFGGCSALTTAPTLPNGVTNIWGIFQGCTSLKTYVGSTDADGDFSRYVIPNTVTNMDSSFGKCRSLKMAPVIPNNVTSIDSTFYESGLTDDGLPTIPSNVHDMNGTFYRCTELVDLSDFVIPNTVTDIENILGECTSLITPPVIPSSVEDLERVFCGCTALTDLSDYIIPSSVTEMNMTFYDCTALTIAPAIPSSVDYMPSTFKNCASLKTAPTIPSNVWEFLNTFQGCTSLTGTIEINADPSRYAECFSGVDFTAQNLTLAGSSTMLDSLGSTGTNYCAECNGKCQGNH